MIQQTNKPIPNVMVGLTHLADLTPVVKAPRVLRVGIGIPKGRASYVYIFQGRFIIRYGVWTADKKLVMETAKGSDGKSGFPTRAEAEKWFYENKKNFAVSNRPQKIPFFTFTRRVVTEESGKPVESFEPDFAAIEAHGETPREIDVVFMSHNPLSGEYAAWSASELNCHGDGLNALRLIQLGNDKWPGWKEAVDAKQKYFPVSECWASELCPYSKEGGKDKLVCKPSATLTFQLASSIRLGATAYFTTTSFRSINNLFSSLNIISSMAERAGSSIMNTPMKLVLAPFRTNHNGIAATQYGVSLELRAEDTKKLRELLAEAAWTPSRSTPLIAAPAEEDDVIEITPSAMAAEFYPEAEFEDGEPEPDTSGGAKAATDKKTEDLATKLAEKRTAPKAEKPAEQKASRPTSAAEAASVAPAAEDNSWPQRCFDAFAEKLGSPRFPQVLDKLGLTLSRVNAENKDRVWNAMNAEVGRGMEDGVPGRGPTEPADLF